MNTEVQTTKPFQERMADRIREQLGDMLTSEELKPLIERLIEEAFFKPRVHYENQGAWNQKAIEREPEFVILARTTIAAEFEKVAKAQVEAWINDHADEFGKIIEETIAKGMFTLVLQHFDQLVRFPMNNLAMTLQQAMSGQTRY